MMNTFYCEIKKLSMRRKGSQKTRKQVSIEDIAYDIF